LIVSGGPAVVKTFVSMLFDHRTLASDRSKDATNHADHQACAKPAHRLASGSGLRI